MKRSRSINLDLMRKSQTACSAKKLTRWVVKPLSLAISGVLLSACSSPEEAIVIESIDDCMAKTAQTEAQCEAAYETAQAEAMRTAPRYRDERSCESEFGAGQCQQSGGSFMPFMMGYLWGSSMNRQYPTTIYRYNRPYSNYHNKVMTADGTVLGSYGKKNYKVDKSAYKPKPTVTRTVSRGGFGSRASAKSSWGGSSSRSSGWGG